MFCIPKRSRITGTTPSDCLVSHQDTRWWGSYPSAEMQSVYLTAPADWANQDGDVDTSCNWRAWNNPKRIGGETGELGNKRTRGDHPDYTIIKIGQNTEKIPGHFRRLPVTQTPMRKQSANADMKNSQMSNDKYSREKYENNRWVALTLNNTRRLTCHYNKKEEYTYDLEVRVTENIKVYTTLFLGEILSGLIVCLVGFHSISTLVVYLMPIECSPMIRETWVQSQIASYQRL